MTLQDLDRCAAARARGRIWRLAAAAPVAFALFCAATPAHAQSFSFRRLERFDYTSFYNTNGEMPAASLLRDAAGNLYGTAVYGGTHGTGTVFELAAQAGGGYTFKVLSEFGGADGANPYGTLVMDGHGNLFGTAVYGGLYGNGTVFELSPSPAGGYTLKRLHHFSAFTSTTSGMQGVNNDGANSYAGLLLDAGGDLFGTCNVGGRYGNGTIYELIPDGAGGYSFKTLRSFSALSQAASNLDGANPYAALAADPNGSLYGTTYYGGPNGQGTVFMLSPDGSGGWVFRRLHSFTFADGHLPVGSVTLDANGDLFGTTPFGGANGTGTVYELEATGGGDYTFRKLHAFSALDTDTGANRDGFRTYATLALDGQGNLYGAASQGGTYAAGTVFELEAGPAGAFTFRTLSDFSPITSYLNGQQSVPINNDGLDSFGGVILDDIGNLFGTAQNGGPGGGGTVFELAATAP